MTAKGEKTERSIDTTSHLVLASEGEEVRAIELSGTYPHASDWGTLLLKDREEGNHRILVLGFFNIKENRLFESSAQLVYMLMYPFRKSGKYQ